MVSTGRHDALAKVMGNDEHGRVRAVGALVTPTDIFGCRGAPSAEEINFRVEVGINQRMEAIGSEREIIAEQRETIAEQRQIIAEMKERMSLNEARCAQHDQFFLQMSRRFGFNLSDMVNIKICL